MNKTTLLLLGSMWLTTLVGLSFFSGYELATPSTSIPFSGGALFLTPIGFLLHFLDPAFFSIKELYFISSKRGDLLNLHALIFLIPIHSVLTLTLLFKGKQD